MLETLGVLENIFKTNPIYRDALARARDRVAAGRPLAASLEETGLFTTMMTNMVRIGEQSGQLALWWNKSPPTTRKEWKVSSAASRNCWNRSSSWAWASPIAGLMMSIYMPMFEMAGKVH